MKGTLLSIAARVFITYGTCLIFVGRFSIDQLCSPCVRLCLYIRCTCSELPVVVLVCNGAVVLTSVIVIFNIIISSICSFSQSVCILVRQKFHFEVSAPQRCYMWCCCLCLNAVSVACSNARFCQGEREQTVRELGLLAVVIIITVNRGVPGECIIILLNLQLHHSLVRTTEHCLEPHVLTTYRSQWSHLGNDDCCQKWHMQAVFLRLPNEVVAGVFGWLVFNTNCCITLFESVASRGEDDMDWT
jgi:hypothetical protein